MKEDFKAIFIEEATDLIADLESSLLSLEKTPSDKKLIERIFRVMHTFKGNCAMFGFEEMGDFTHHLENIYDQVREDKLKVNSEILDVTLESIDHLKNFLNDFELKDQNVKKAHGKLINKFISIIENDNQSESADQPIEEAGSGQEKTYLIQFSPVGDIMQKGNNPLFIMDDLNGLGETKILTRTAKLPEFEKLDPSVCYTYWDIFLVTRADQQAIREVFIFLENAEVIPVHLLANQNLFSNPSFLKEIEENYSNQENLQYTEVSDFVNKLLGIKIPDNQDLEDDQEEADVPVVNIRTQNDNKISSIRVSSEKLDMLMNLVSELVTTQAALSLFAENQQSPELMGLAENVEKISRRLRDNTFSICLIPIENMLTRFKRLVRDLSGELKKQVEFKTEGADTELDKSIIDSLVDPLMHILRNSMDHGIEDPETRKKAGKPAKGTILIKSFYSGTNVFIQIKDDGKGIDPDKIRQKAIEKGIITADSVMNKREIFDLLFAPGFSTAEKVTEVSGRGVGMDVVKRKILDIRGEVEIDSEINQGTTITIKLPLTLSIIDGLLVRVKDTHFVIPLSSVEKCYEIRHSKMVGNFNNLVILDGEQLPYCYLREEFRIPGEAPAIEQIVSVIYEEKRVGLTVDEVIGEYQAVLKPLGKMYKEIDIVSGATILGDGTIALVLDTNRIIKYFSHNLITEDVL